MESYITTGLQIRSLAKQQRHYSHEVTQRHAFICYLIRR